MGEYKPKWLSLRWYMNLWPITLGSDFPNFFHRGRLWGLALWSAYLLGWATGLNLFHVSDFTIIGRAVSPLDVAAIVLYFVVRFWYRIPGVFVAFNYDLKVGNNIDRQFGQWVLMTFSEVPAGLILARLVVLVWPIISAFFRLG